jgi:Papain family cysteine protease
MTERIFDYVPRLDERNLAYRVGAISGLVDTERFRYWNPGVVLDQGSEGACVGFGCTAEALASPVRWRPVDPDTPGPWAHLNPAQRGAQEVYRRAKEIDEWEGVDYEGTSVRAGMLVGRERGWWEGFRWALNMTELRAALELGPVVIGVEWRESMYEAPGGWLQASGPVVGGHCILVTGYSPRRRLGKLDVRAYRLRNSWGSEWGVNGSAYISAAELEYILFGAGGEAAVPVDRLA